MTLDISIWSDIACPWCFVGKRRLEAALTQFKQQHGASAPEVQIKWRSFELDPRKKDLSDTTPYVERLAKKYGRTTAQAQAMVDSMAETGRVEGIAFDFKSAIPANTFDAHRLLQWAGTLDDEAEKRGEKERSAQSRLKEAFVTAHLEQGKDLNASDVLLSVASEVGLDVDRASAILASDEFAMDVRGDEEEAKMHGISGVPFFAIGRYGVSGAQKPQTLLEVLERAHKELKQEQEAEMGTLAEEGAVCGPDGC